MKNIYVIIVTYNGMPWIPVCLKTLINFNVVVIDNNSTDGTVSYIESNHPGIKIFKQRENLGFGKANNIGLSYALQRGAKYFLLINQDVYIQERDILNLAAILKVNDSYGILSPVHLDSTLETLDNDFANFIGGLNADRLVQKKNHEIYPFNFINAAAWLVSKECVKKVGGFDPIFFHYGEDDNYCQRVLYHNLKIGVVSGCFMIHDKEGQLKFPVIRGTEKYFLKKERILKIQFGDINKPETDELRKRIKYFKQRRIKSFLFLNLHEFIYNTRFIKMLKKVSTDIKRSREKNKMPGMNYL